MITGVVGLDLSLTSTGIARFGVDGNDTVQALATKPEDFDNPGKRFEFILEGILKNVMHTDRIFIEDYSFGVKAKVSRLATLAELGGIVKYVLWRKVGEWPTVVSIQTIKAWVKAQHKDQMRLEAYKRFGIEYKTTDEVDAYVLADFGWSVTLMGDAHKRKTLAQWERHILDRFIVREVKKEAENRKRILTNNLI